MSQHDPQHRPSSPETPAVARFPGRNAFDAGSSRGVKDGADWARHRAATADLRALCDRSHEKPLGADQFAALLDRYQLQPRSLAAASGHDPDQYDSGYRNGFQRGAESVWQWLCNVVVGLEQIP